jgi:hypothetical protein
MRTLLDVNNEIITLTEEITTGTPLKPAQVSRRKNRIS